MSLNKLSVTGRGQLVVRARADETGLTICVDDRRNDEFWLNVYLTRAELAEAIRLVDAEAAGIEEAELVEDDQ